MTDRRAKIVEVLKAEKDPEKAATLIEQALDKPPLSPWWYSKERLESLTARGQTK
jgi:hypothetical protein